MGNSPPPDVTLDTLLDLLDECPAHVPLYDPPLAAAYLGITSNTLRVYRHSTAYRHMNFPAPGVVVGKSPRWSRLQLDTFNTTRRPAHRPVGGTPE